MEMILELLPAAHNLKFPIRLATQMDAGRKRHPTFCPRFWQDNFFGHQAR